MRSLFRCCQIFQFYRVGEGAAEPLGRAVVTKAAAEETPNFTNCNFIHIVSLTNRGVLRSTHKRAKRRA